MKLENNWKQKTLDSLEKRVSIDANSKLDSYLIGTCRLPRKKQLQDFSIEDLRIMIGQEIGLYFLIPLAIEALKNNLFAEGDMYQGDLLVNVLNIDVEFWRSNKYYWHQLNDLIKDRLQEIEEMKFSTSKFCMINSI